MLYGLVCLVILARLHSFKLLLFFKTIVIKLIKMMALFVNLQGLNGVLLTPYSDRRFHLVYNQSVMNTVTFFHVSTLVPSIKWTQLYSQACIQWWWLAVQSDCLGSFSSAETLIYDMDCLVCSVLFLKTQLSRRLIWYCAAIWGLRIRILRMWFSQFATIQLVL